MSPTKIYGDHNKNNTNLIESIRTIQERTKILMDATPIPAHGYDHVERVYKTGVYLGKELDANPFILEPALLMHDLGRIYEKQANGVPHAELSVPIATYLLKDCEYPAKYIEPISYAIRVHSRGNRPETLEAKIVQDADKLDLYGTIGLLRIFAWGGMKGKKEVSNSDPLAETGRVLDKRQYSVDHLIEALPKVKNGLNTPIARKIAEEREPYLKDFLTQLKVEIENGEFEKNLLTIE